MERLIEHAARQIGMDPRRNPPPQPDPADQAALHHADALGLRLRRVRPPDGHSASRTATGRATPRASASRKKNGKLRGRAVSFYIEFGGIFNDRMDLQLRSVRRAHHLRRHPFARPGPRHRVRAARARNARRAVRADPLRAGRHRAGRDRPRHLRRAQRGGRRQRAEARRRRHDREGQEARRRHDGGRRGRHRVQGRQLPRHRHRQGDRAGRRRQGVLSRRWGR